jgi:hypothetical protein
LIPIKNGTGQLFAQSTERYTTADECDFAERGGTNLLNVSKENSRFQPLNVGPEALVDYGSTENQWNSTVDIKYSN